MAGTLQAPRRIYPAAEKTEPPLDERFLEIMDEQLKTVPLEISEMFIDGFRLGARMMIEIYQKDFTDTYE